MFSNLLYYFILFLLFSFFYLKEGNPSFFLSSQELKGDSKDLSSKKEVPGFFFKKDTSPPDNQVYNENKIKEVLKGVLSIFPFYKGKKDPSIGHPYGLFISRKEDDLMQSSFHRYGLRSIPKYLATRGYFLIEKMNEEEKIRTSLFYRKDESSQIDLYNIFNLFKEFKKPKIKIFILGNQLYEDPKHQTLSYVYNDTFLMSKIASSILEVPKKNIFLYKDLTLLTFQQKFKKFIKGLKSDELVIVYYSGISKDNGMPIFVDGKSIKSNSFYGLLNSFKNDTVLLMDISKDPLSLKKIKSKKEDSFEVKEEFIEMKQNILKLISPLRLPKKKEKIFFYKKKYFDSFQAAYFVLELMNVNKKQGFGLSTFLFFNAFIDFIINFNQVNLHLNGFASLIDNKISSLAESNIFIKPHLKYPLLKIRFRKNENEFLLYKDLVLNYLPLMNEKNEAYLTEEAKLMLNTIQFEFQQKRRGLEYKKPYLVKLSDQSKYTKKQFNLNNSLTYDKFYLNKRSLVMEAIRLNNLGNKMALEKKFKEALKFYKKSLELKKQIKSKRLLANIYNNIGSLYFNTNDSKKAFFYFKKAFDLYPSNNRVKKVIKANLNRLEF